MDLGVGVLPPWLVACGWSAALPVLALAIVLAPWTQLRRDGEAHLFCGGMVALVLLWMMHAPLGSDANVHLLGVAAYTLLLGPALALAGSAIALLIVTAMQGGAWINAGAGYAMMVLLPVLVTTVVVRATRRCVHAHPLVETVVSAWLAGAASFAISHGAGELLLIVGAHASRASSPADGVALLACLASGEATLTGLVLTLFVVSHPHAVQALREREGQRL